MRSPSIFTEVFLADFTVTFTGKRGAELSTRLNDVESPGISPTYVILFTSTALFKFETMSAPCTTLRRLSSEMREVTPFHWGSVLFTCPSLRVLVLGMGALVTLN
jgi:hypothetical protein